MKEEEFPRTRKPLHWRRWGDEQGWSFGAMEEISVTRMQKAKWRDSCIEDQCRPTLTSLRGLPAHPLGQAGAGS